MGRGTRSQSVGGGPPARLVYQLPWSLRQPPQQGPPSLLSRVVRGLPRSPSLEAPGLRLTPRASQAVESVCVCSHLSLP